METCAIRSECGSRCGIVIAPRGFVVGSAGAQRSQQRVLGERWEAGGGDRGARRLRTNGNERHLNGGAGRLRLRLWVQTCFVIACTLFYSLATASASRSSMSHGQHLARKRCHTPRSNGPVRVMCYTHQCRILESTLRRRMLWRHVHSSVATSRNVGLSLNICVFPSTFGLLVRYKY